MLKILFLTQTNETGASARYRVYQFLDYLERNGIDCTVSPAVSDNLLRNYHGSASIFKKPHFYLSQILKRISELKKINNFDVVYFQRDIVIHFYPILEEIIALLNKNIIFDFDDAIYLYPSHKKIGFLFKILWDRKKIERIIKLSKHVIVGNNFLKDYAQNFTKNVTVIPTSIDLTAYKINKIPGQLKGDTIKIGWLGSQGTFEYLKMLFPVFEELAKKYKIELMVIGAKGPLPKGFRINYKDWDLSTEVRDMAEFDIGVMPLTDDEWSRGKSGTKLLQYMAAGIPAIASSVGINTEIIRDGINGFLADTKDAWVKKIPLLIENEQLRAELVNNARSDVERFYSVQANASKLLEVIKKVTLNN